jgi:hypothetical protein
MQEFLENLFGDELPSELRVAVFTTPSKRTRFFADYQEIEQDALLQRISQNVYFGLGLIRGQRPNANPRAPGTNRRLDDPHDRALAFRRHTQLCGDRPRHGRLEKHRSGRRQRQTNGSRRCSSLA